jgi:hypothetical protein
MQYQSPLKQENPNPLYGGKIQEYTGSNRERNNMIFSKFMRDPTFMDTETERVAFKTQLNRSYMTAIGMFLGIPLPFLLMRWTDVSKTQRIN